MARLGEELLAAVGRVPDGLVESVRAERDAQRGGGNPGRGRRMTVVVDTGVVVGLFLRVPGWATSRERFREWTAAGRPVHAPALLLYEVASVLARIIRMGGGPAAVGERAAAAVIDRLLELGIRFAEPTADLLGRSLVWARRLGPGQASDAQFVALADLLGAELWTADGRLAELGFSRVRSVLEPGGVGGTDEA